jgi:hypothetical protein
MRDTSFPGKQEAVHKRLVEGAVFAYQQALNLFIIEPVEHLRSKPVGNQQQNRPGLLDAQTHPDIVEPSMILLD